MNEGMPPLEEGKNSFSGLRKIAEASLLAGSLLAAEAPHQELEAQMSTASSHVEIVKELSGEETIVPRKVFDAYSRIVDSARTGGKLSGGFNDRNYLSGDREVRFAVELMGLGYSNTNIRQFVDVFKSPRIVFPDDVVDSPEFNVIHQHEWMHKLIHDLSPEEKATLDEARDSILNEYKKADLVANESTRDMAKKAKTLSEEAVVDAKAKEILNQANPALLGSDQTALFSLLANAEEFYPYLLNGKFNPRVEEIIRVQFPKADAIFERMKKQVDEKVR